MPLPIIFVSLDQNKIDEAINQQLAALNLKLEQPDVLLISEKINLEQIKKVSQHLLWKSVSKSGRVVILNPADSLTLEAQNGLLKILEEPQGNATILLGVRDESHFLQTVLSRCEVRYINQPSSQVDMSEIEELIKLSPAERLEKIEKKDDRKSLLDSLMQFYYQDLPIQPKNSQALRLLIESTSWVKQNVSAKAVTDYLMLILPEYKKSS